MPDEENRYYKRTRLKIVKLKYKHFDADIKFEKSTIEEEYDKELVKEVDNLFYQLWIDTDFHKNISLLPYNNELFQRPLNKDNLSRYDYYYKWFGYCNHFENKFLFCYNCYFCKMIKIRDVEEWTFYATKESACFDLRSRKDHILLPKERILVSTGVYIDKIDEDIHGKIYSKSGIALTYSVIVLNSPGIIDSDYKDEIKVLLYNTSKKDYYIKRGEAVAQMGFIKTLKPYKIVTEFVECSCREVTTSMIKEEVRNGGFGSTGK
ncbi:deoxyuridine 5'-triphosphate nucleotidohydrolase-like [Hydra vulgaris]|uniref:Deoxyuridine 5'-triphosphate nucleotidohydrolase n=1 Tax=Hydra vulgaris TaxID=6087 RepID=A0ABM4DMC7_HYDVU